uniref:Uncharacterized protein n=1 Tax=Dunaliella tertiolecta TaxID=3047 RepID=A0A7S3VN24_DUNTE
MVKKDPAASVLLKWYATTPLKFELTEPQGSSKRVPLPGRHLTHMPLPNRSAENPRPRVSLASGCTNKWRRKKQTPPWSPPKDSSAFNDASPPFSQCPLTGPPPLTAYSFSSFRIFLLLIFPYQGRF